MPVSERIQGACTPVYLQKGAPYGGVARVREEPNPRARPPSLEGPYVKFYGGKVSAAPRADQSRRCSYDPAAGVVMYLALWRRSGAHFTAF